jgi:hypothetical protein
MALTGGDDSQGTAPTGCLVGCGGDWRGVTDGAGLLLVGGAGVGEGPTVGPLTRGAGAGATGDGLLGGFISVGPGAPIVGVVVAGVGLVGAGVTIEVRTGGGMLLMLVLGLIRVALGVVPVMPSRIGLLCCVGTRTGERSPFTVASEPPSCRQPRWKSSRSKSPSKPW